MTDTKKITITVADVAQILAGNYDTVDAAVRLAVVKEMADSDDYCDDLIQSLPVTVTVHDDGSSEDVECDYGDDYGDAAEDLWSDADYGDGDYRVSVSWVATDAAGREIKTGGFDVEGQTPEPECPEGEHDWTAEGEGGCDQNPGVWSTGGTSMVFRTHCRNCGMQRRETTTGSQCNPGECDTTSYEVVEKWCQECQSEKCTCDSDES